MPLVCRIPIPKEAYPNPTPEDTLYDPAPVVEFLQSGIDGITGVTIEDAFIVFTAENASTRDDLQDLQEQLRHRFWNSIDLQAKIPRSQMDPLERLQADGVFG